MRIYDWRAAKFLSWEVFQFHNSCCIRCMFCALSHRRIPMKYDAIIVGSARLERLAYRLADWDGL